MKSSIAVLLLGVAACVGVGAQVTGPAQAPQLAPQPVPQPPPQPGSPPVVRVEAYGSHHDLTGGFSDWREAGLRVERGTAGRLLRAELVAMRRFDEGGAFAGLGGVFDIDADWYAGLSAGAGDGASYLPRARVDGFINRKLLAARNLVASLGAGYYRAPDGHVDRNLSLGAIYYFEFPLVVQAELRFNRSNPGEVRTNRRAVAVTWGRADATQLVARHGWGGEGYQALGPAASLINFRSRETSVAVRHRFSRRWGAAIALERYRNPIYERRGVTASLLLEFP